MRLESQLGRYGEWPIVALIAALGAALRWGAIGGDYYGDEAWYMYLARTWGADSAAVAGGPNPVTHLIYRPLFYLLYHFPAYGGLTVCRALTCVIGAATIPLTCALAKRFGAGRPFVYIAGLVVACHPNLVRFNTLAFPDTLAGAFLVGAALLYAKRRYVWAPLFITFAVLTKESTAAYCIVVCFMAWRRGDGWLKSAAYLVPLIYVAASIYIAVHVLGSRPQGWGTRPLGLEALRHMLAGPELLPFALALIARRQWEPFLFWATSPLFYAIWSWVFGRGVFFWYAVAPAPVAAAAIAVGAQSAWDWLSKRDAIAAVLARHRDRIAQLTPLGLIAITAALTPTAWIGFQRISGPRQNTPLADAEAIVRQRNPKEVTFINCHFAIAYEPLRTSTSKSSITYVDDSTPSPTTDLAVWCKDADGKHAAPPVRFSGCTLLHTSGLAVYSREPCASQRDTSPFVSADRPQPSGANHPR